ncbi:hypothetical protein [Phyllobacterium zundukense]|uniref:Uncharacterized protein n=1 Tax=Phyllobacterium zundukense TaxID=1867719 RepID=A0ACD4CU75_9HYPH|nr:hypothetical protein [Phyllobacterium zundukense]UXN57106.1 hypothetical protein N8E88_01365 [Phyllobacterium zundukense]
MPDRHEFHRVEICGRIFTGSISAEGPCLKMLENRTYGRGVPLGAALSISKGAGRTYYAICKYNEPYILLPRFTDEDVEIVAREFGIPISGRIRPRSFTESPAWVALRKWAKEHPGIARACSHTDSYIPGWYRMVAKENSAGLLQRV